MRRVRCVGSNFGHAVPSFAGVEVRAHFFAINFWFENCRISIPTFLCRFGTSLNFKREQTTASVTACLFIAKGQRAPNAQLTHQIVDRHHTMKELKFSGPDSQTLKNPF
jgi:hypothetical protein